MDKRYTYLHFVYASLRYLPPEIVVKHKHKHGIIFSISRNNNNEHCTATFSGRFSHFALREYVYCTTKLFNKNLLNTIIGHNRFALSIF